MWREMLVCTVSCPAISIDRGIELLFCSVKVCKCKTCSVFI
jgi:hypothetical protein